MKGETIASSYRLACLFSLDPDFLSVHSCCPVPLRLPPPMTKTLSFACVHFSVAFTVGWALSGDWRVGGALAVVEPLCNTVAFHFHEKLWQHRQRGQAAPMHALHQQHAT